MIQLGVKNRLLRVVACLLIVQSFVSCNTGDSDCEQWYSGNPCMSLTEQIQGLYQASGNCGTINILVAPSDSLMHGFRIFLGGVSSQTFIWAEFTNDTDFVFPLQFIQGGTIEGGGRVTADGLTYNYNAGTSGGGFGCTFNCTPSDGGMLNGDSFDATIDGARWEADLAIDSYVSNYTSLVGVSTDGTLIDLLINGEVTVGNYSTIEGEAEAQISLRTGFNDGEQYFSTWPQGSSGQVVITSVSPSRITGTFSCTVVNESSPGITKTITSGGFDVTL